MGRLMHPMARVFITGSSDAVKSAVGLDLAQRLGFACLEIDEYISLSAGMAIPEIRRRESEEGFRRRESRALAWAAGLPNTVIIAGGRAVLSAAGRRLMSESGAVVELDVVQDPRRAREDADYQAHLSLETAGLSPGAAADRIVAWLGESWDLRPRATSSGVRQMSAAPRGDPVYLGEGLLVRPLPEPCAGPARVIVLSEPAVWSLYGRMLKESLAGAGGEPELLLLSGTEAVKSREGLATVHDFLVDRGCRRDTPLLVLGGGVLGDLGGFAAATYMRGIPLMQVPTTLLSQVDSSVGGKVAINHPAGKNLIGTFYPADACIADQSVLLTLPDREFAGGMAEVVKTALLCGEEFLTWLEGSNARLRAREPALLTEMVARCVQFKSSLVAADERDHGPRMLLNLGHTLGHTLEKLGDYSALTHGEAVAVGLVWAARLSERMGLSAPGLGSRLRGLLEAFGLRADAKEFGFDSGEVLEQMRGDKKSRASGLNLILPHAVGDVRITPGVSYDVIAASLGEFLGGD